MSAFPELKMLVEEWALNRDLIQDGNSIAQATKTVEEATELLKATCANNEEQIIDGIGDVIVTIIILCKIKNMDLEGCLGHAYNQIKDRTGQTINGTFVKDQED